MNTYNEYYRENVVPALMDALKVKSPMQVPRLKKITLNMGLGSAVSDKKVDLKGYTFVARNKTIKFPHVFNDCWDFRFRSCAVTPKNMLL